MPADPILRLPRCLVRPYDEGDIEQLAEKANNLKISCWMRDAFPHPYTTEHAKSWVAFATSASPILNYAICRPDASTLMGGIGLKKGEDVYHRTMEVGYWLAEDCWGQGIAAEVVAAFSDWVFAEFESVLRLEAEVFDGNQASARVLEKTGFVLEGKRKNAIEKSGVVMDALMYCKLRDT